MSDTVKLIIEIPKGVVEYIKNNGCLAVGYLDEVAKAIQNSTPLDDVKAEIREKSFDHYFECGEYIGEDCRKERIIYLDQVLEILDNIGKAESQKLADDIGFLNQSLEDAIDCS